MRTLLDSITLEEVVQGVPGDATGDGLVNLDDVNAVRNCFGEQQQRLGDADTNGVVNLDDLNAVRNNLDSAPVPETSTLALLSLGAVGTLSRRRILQTR